MNAPANLIRKTPTRYDAAALLCTLDHAAAMHLLEFMARGDLGVVVNAVLDSGIKMVQCADGTSDYWLELPGVTQYPAEPKAPEFPSLVQEFCRAASAAPEPQPADPPTHKFVGPDAALLRDHPWLAEFTKALYQNNKVQAIKILRAATRSDLLPGFDEQFYRAVGSADLASAKDAVDFLVDTDKDFPNLRGNAKEMVNWLNMNANVSWINWTARALALNPGLDPNLA